MFIDIKKICEEYLWKFLPVLEKVVNWIASTPSSSSIPYYEMEEVLTLINFPVTFA
jgi:hypothetical protein